MTVAARPPMAEVRPDEPPPPLGGPSLESELGLTDTRNAERFLAAHPELRYDQPRAQWWIFDGTTWRPDATGAVLEKAQGLAARIYAEAAQAETASARKALGKWARDTEQRRGIEGFVRLAQARVPVTPADFDRDPLRVNTPSGVVDIRTGDCGSSDPAQLHSRCTGVPFDPTATAPRWDQFLLEIFAGDADLVAYVQRAVGYALTGDTREQVFFLLHGSGANGKTTFVEAIAHAMGSYARTTSFDAFLARDRAHAGPSPELAQLPGARFVHASESSASAAFAEHTLKLVTGGDQLEVRGLYQSPFTFTPQFKLWLLTNHRPHIRGRDHAIWRRVHLIPFLRTFSGEQKDPGLAARFTGPEAPGILAWCVAGAQLWLEQGLRPPATVLQAIEEYRSATDELGPFLDDQCERAPSFWTPTADLFKAYQRWAEHEGDRPLGKTAFGRLLAQHGFTEARRGGRQIRGWGGLRLRSITPDLLTSDRPDR